MSDFWFFTCDKCKLFPNILLFYNEEFATREIKEHFLKKKQAIIDKVLVI